MPSRRNGVYALIIVAIIAGLGTGQAFFFNIAYGFGGLLVVAYVWAWLSVRWLGISRKTRARRAQVGRHLDEVFTIHNRTLLPKLWLEVRDFSELPGHKASHVVPAIGPRGQYRWYVQTPCLARGEFRLGPMALKSGDPFGLFVAPRRMEATSSVIVYPRTVSLSKFELPMAMLSGGEPQRRRSHTVTTNAVSVREYVAGDSFNRIHWRSSARRSKLMVKEFELDPLVDVHLFVDLSVETLYEAPGIKRIGGNGPVMSSGGALPPSTEEYSVVVAASLARYFIDSQRALGFFAYTPAREVLIADRGERQLTRILQVLATARSQTPYTLAQMLSLEATHLARGATVIIITASTDVAWVTETQILARRGTRPMCVFVDPASFGKSVDTDEIRGMLTLSRIPTLAVRWGDDLSLALSQMPL
jgi:uncharacterized protein (DUF58 family)